MPAPTTTDEFLDLIAKSGVAEEARVKSFLLKISPTGEIPSEPSKLAGLMVRDGLLTYFQADQLLQGKWKRFFIGKYKVLERLGSGGMGQVFLCEHKLMRRRVAVKVLPAVKAQDPSALERFYREARAVAALDHPNIVRAYDIDQDDNLHFLVMEYVDGSNLQELVKNHGALDPLRAAHYIYGSAVGLQHAHEMGLVHRDIKPGNILIDRSGVVKILDMGLARFFRDDDDQLTKKYDENILGTADYLAPEQAIDSHAVDIRADLYSLGGTFYYLLAGQPPFPEGTVAQKLLWHQTREPALVRQVRPAIAPEMAEVVAKMMAKDPNRRYQSPAEVMAALSVWVQSPISPPEEREMPQLSPAVAASSGGGTITSRVIASSPTMVTGPIPSSAVVPARASERVSEPRADGRSQGPLTPATAISAAPSFGSAAAHPAVWDELTSETRANSRADTDEPQPNPRIPDSPRRREPVVPLGKSSRLLLVLAAVGVLGFLFLGGAAATAYFVFFRVKPTVPPNAGPRTWYVSRNEGPDPERTLRSLQGALDQARANDTILILDDRIEDPPLLFNDSSGKRRGVRIEAGNASKSVVWAPATPPKSSSVLDLANADGVLVSGLVFELDGKTDSGITLRNHCAGVTIENVTVRNPRAAGFHFVSVNGDPARPARLNRCRVTTSSRIDYGIKLVGANRHVAITNNRLEGGGSMAIRFEGPAEDFEIRNNRIYRFDLGVVLAGKLTPANAFSLNLENNTFHSIVNTAVLVDVPLSGPTQSVTIERNYFAGGGAIAASSAPKPNLKASQNARDRLTKEGGASLAAIPVLDYNLPNPNPDSDADFLRPAPGRLTAVGPTKAAVGAHVNDN